ncbi:hypothetical protein [Rhizobium oryziradicis]|nr:hypothetical protein [Rhizobium oryziradicis]
MEVKEPADGIEARMNREEEKLERASFPKFAQVDIQKRVERFETGFQSP